jgi:hypothetical protein
MKIIKVYDFGLPRYLTTISFAKVDLLICFQNISKPSFVMRKETANLRHLDRCFVSYHFGA